jgi:peptide/nickel transport system substrate-binding protein
MAATTSWRPAYAGSRVTRRNFLKGAAAGAGAAALIACGGGETKQTLTVSPDQVRVPGAVLYAKDNWKLADETSQAVKGGIHPGRANADINEGFSPTLMQSGPTGSFLETVYEYLVAFNRGPGVAPGTPEYRTMRPLLAESWEASDDASTFTFHMRPNVKFHNVAPVNGRVMTMDDWRSTINAFTEKVVSASNGWRWSTRWNTPTIALWCSS